MNFLEHYNDELRHLREGGARFARENPQVASALGLHTDSVTDPFVERLLEGVSYLAARVHTRMDQECAEFAQQALASLAPLYQRATPAITSVAFHPDLGSPEAYRSKTIPRGTALHALLPGRSLPVTFCTAREVTLWPLQLSSAECARSLVSMPTALATALFGGQGLIRLRFSIEGNATLADLLRDSVERSLHLTLAGDLPRAFALHRTLLADCSGCFAVLPDERGDLVLPLAPNALRLSGLADEQALLPPDLGALPGLRLLREYFAQPSRFLGLEVDALTPMAKAAPGARQFDLVFKLKRLPADLLGEVSASQFRLFATPVVNLYPKRLDPVPFNPDHTEQWLPVDRMRPQAHHLWSLTEVHFCERDGLSRQAFSSLHQSGFHPQQSLARFSERHVPAALSSGTPPERDDPLDYSHYVTLALPGQSAALERVSTLLCKGLVADRGFKPHTLLDAQFLMQEARAVDRIECLWPASVPRPAPDLAKCWDAVRQLGANPLAHRGPGSQDVTTALSECVLLATHDQEANDLQRLSSLRSASTAAGFSRAGRHSPMAWVRTLKLTLDIAQAQHADQGAWLFGRVLAQAVSDMCALNDGLEVHLCLDGEAVSHHTNTDNAEGVLL